jgi:hypothetical protein
MGDLGISSATAKKLNDALSVPGYLNINDALSDKAK